MKLCRKYLKGFNAGDPGNQEAKTNLISLVLHGPFAFPSRVFYRSPLVDPYVTDYQRPDCILSMHFSLRTLQFNLIRITAINRLKFRLVFPIFIFPIVKLIVINKYSKKMPSDLFKFTNMMFTVVYGRITSHLVVYYSHICFTSNDDNDGY